jgi:hypothetical protein
MPNLNSLVLLLRRGSSSRANLSQFPSSKAPQFVDKRHRHNVSRNNQLMGTIRMGKLKYFLVCLLFFFLLIWSYSGICFSKKMRMSDETYIRSAVQSIILNELASEHLSVDDFIDKNPNCCSVDRFGGNNVGNILFSLIGKYRVIVNIHYPIFEKNIRKIYYSEYFVSACGKVGFESGIAY